MSKQVSFQDDELQDTLPSEPEAPVQLVGKRSAQDRAGVKFPISKLAACAKKGKHADRISQGVPVYMAGVLEYLAFEIIELAAAKAGDEKQRVIMPRHLMLAIKTDAEFKKFLGRADFKETGRVPMVVEGKRGKKGKGKGDDEDSEWEDPQ